MKIINENILYDKKEHVIRRIICEKIEKTDMRKSANQTIRKVSNWKTILSIS